MKSARVLLVVPIRHGRGVSHRSTPPHIGLASIAAWLERRGVTVSIFDGTITRSEDAFERKLREFAPTLVGITAYTRYVRPAARAALAVKRYDPSVVTVLGGPHATALPEDSLREFPGFDVSVVGEGEEPMALLAEAQGDTGRYATIPGIRWREGDQIRSGGPVRYVDMADMPRPAWHLFDLACYTLDSVLNHEVLDGSKEFRVEVNRGCPCACTFCSHVLGFKLRTRPVEAVIEELTFLRAHYGARSIIFNADTFTIDRNYAVRLCEEMIARNLHQELSWMCETRVDKLDRPLLDLMKRAGCRAVIMGLESGSPEILKTVGKGYGIEAMRPGVQMIRDAGMLSLSNFIFGLPGETRRTAWMTISCARSLPLDYATFTVYVPFPGSPITRFVERTPGYRIRTKDWDVYDTQGGRFLIEHPGISRLGVVAMHRLAYLLFYLRPGFLRRPFQFLDVTSLPILNRLFSSSQG